jgi:limonene-1,2-epoxide hydrolase
MTETRESSDPEAVVRAFFASWDTAGFHQSYLRYLAGEVVLWNPGVGEWKGRDTVLAALARYLSVFKRPYASVEVLALVAAGGTVLAERIETNRNPDNGDSFTQPMMSSMIVEDGLIVRWADYYDRGPYRPGGEAHPH